jgi:membrane-associated protein
VVRTLMPAAAGTSGLPYRKFFPAVLAGAACWSAMHIAIGAALGEAAKRIEGLITTGGTYVLGGLALILVTTVVIRKRRKAKRVLAMVAVDADPELEPA